MKQGLFERRSRNQLTWFALTGAGFGGEWVASVFIMEGSDVPFVEEEGAVAAACLEPGEVMCEA